MSPSTHSPSRHADSPLPLEMTVERKIPLGDSIITISTVSSTAKLAEDKKKEKSTGDEYDPFAERNLDNAYSDVGALAHLLKSSLGSGILAMPNAFRNAGLAFGMVATLFVGLICTHTVQILVKCSQELCRRTKVPFLGFGETAEAAFKTSCFERLRSYSKFARNFVVLAILSTYYGSCCVYVVFIGESLHKVCGYYVPWMNDLDVRVYMVVMLPVFLGLVLVRQLKHMVPVSVAADVALLVSLVITLYYTLSGVPSASERDLIAPVSQLPLFFSTVIFAMEGIGVVMPVENSMKNPQRFLGCPGVLNITMSIVVGLYAIIGFCGYLKYGPDTEGSVTLNLPSDEPLAQSVNILIALAIVLTYGLQMFVPNDISLALVMEKVPPHRAELVQYCYRIGTCLATVAVAVAIPKLEPIISLVGSVFVSTLGLFCPAVLETVVFWEDGMGRLNWRLWKNIFIAAFSIFGLVTGSYVAVLEIIRTYSG
ncbi:proton-coupled amino acid transporter-like protein CG1139 isoform X1 [Schistocerca gregaria]|uniref:proton-coupled amino acid transporter-like protein CG1139 isoform X1 n=2 Tax=Schistocerca gregaria TaxID=7010 RepID=UPI00211DCC61|nr:proton-coupled amino acid transporter-like protein CG1139 isoform X1 [Schistocerca gregaria]